MRWFVRRDLDGFFGLFVDNLVQLLLIVALCGELCGMSGDGAHYLYGRILPGAAVSILFGNLFYAWQAHRLAKASARNDVTALPYGINTPSLIIYVFFVMAPVYRETNDVRLAWHMGMLACLGSGIIEFACAFVAEWVRRHTPRAALLSTLAGIAIGFIAMTFALKIWSWPLIALVPTGIVLITYFSGVRMPGGLPGGLVAVVLGTALAWIIPTSWTGREMAASSVVAAWSDAGVVLPVWSGGALLSVLQQPPETWLRFLSVIVPMGLFNVIGSLQNIESAEAAGDLYDTRTSLSMNGLGTILAASLGSCFPTTIYIGHPGWKALGARGGYSTLNGVVITLICLTGTVALVDSLIPIEAGMAIVLWIGIVITAQAFQATPRDHAPAVALGLFPAIAAWGATVAAGVFGAAGGATIQAFLEADVDAEVGGFLLHGLIVLERGYIFTCMVVAAIGASLVDRRFYSASVWSLVGAVLALLGLCHAYQVSGNALDFLLLFTTPADGALAYRADNVAIGYALTALLFVIVGMAARPSNPR
ncbi:MAG: NCS2 family permease [Phycisphaerae bacterium]|jgi:AGZA family xanthine/uracil permease-like MFS transporter